MSYASNIPKFYAFLLFAPLLGLFTDLFSPGAAFFVMGAGLLLIAATYGFLALLGRDVL